ncbi:MAG: hypothetical protein AAFN10_16020 [Bacteroidota bacterium]
MKKNILFLLCVLGLSFSACEQDQLSPNLPDCIANQIPELEDANVSGNRLVAPSEIVSVYRHKHNLKNYYELVYRVRDGFTELFDSNCEYVCSPNGGSLGGGRGDCPDWVKLDERELIWQLQ